MSVLDPPTPRHDSTAGPGSVANIMVGINREMEAVIITIADEDDGVSLYLTPDMATTMAMVLVELSKELGGEGWQDKESLTSGEKITGQLH